MTAIVMGPAPCQSCHVPVTWDGRAWTARGDKHRCRRPACMSVAEYEAWAEPNRVLGKPAASPCADCLPSFALVMKGRGLCDGEPGSQRVASSASDRLRLQWRLAARRAREKKRMAREAAA